MHFFSNCEQSRKKLRLCFYSLKESLIESFIVCAKFKCIALVSLLLLGVCYCLLGTGTKWITIILYLLILIIIYFIKFSFIKTICTFLFSRWSLIHLGENPVVTRHNWTFISRPGRLMCVYFRCCVHWKCSKLTILKSKEKETRKYSNSLSMKGARLIFKSLHH